VVGLSPDKARQGGEIVDFSIHVASYHVWLESRPLLHARKAVPKVFFHQGWLPNHRSPAEANECA